MILLTAVRLINWYGFTNITAPVGKFTLIAGKNGNGKSVLLDAIKYAAFGDTVFNKSSETKGGRTVISYTRGLLDATAKTYMRPADKSPNVYTHIVLEFFDDVNEKHFIFGTVIETSAANNYLTYRYVKDRTDLKQIEHTFEENDITYPYNASDLQKKYNVTLMNREDGLAKFTQMLGLRFTIPKLQDYVRKLRGIMSYDPNSQIDKFIRQSVLEDKKVDFGKLAEAKANIEKLANNFETIDNEIKELNAIIKKYDDWEKEFNRLKTEEIKINYKRINDLTENIEFAKNKNAQAEFIKEKLQSEISDLEKQKEEISARLIMAKDKLLELDCTKNIDLEKQQLYELENLKAELALKCKRLESFQTKISELINLFAQVDIEVKNKSALASLCSNSYAVADKIQAVTLFKKQVDDYHETIIKNIAGTERDIQNIDNEIIAQQKIIEDSKKHYNSYKDIPDYIGLKNEINKEFQKLKIEDEARLACEYVAALNDEEWRNAIEAFLGPRRYTVLVNPQYYDVADDIFNKTRYRHAHLFNTKLLMRKTIKVEEDSPVFKLEIKNEVAQEYFNFQLGRMHAVKINEVRNFENAISKEGRVSVAMDSYFLNFARLNFYYLGQEVFELNRKRAEKAIENLKIKQEALCEKQKGLLEIKSILSVNREYFTEYDYEAHEKYRDTLSKIKKSQQRLKELLEAQKNNKEFIARSMQIEHLEAEQNSIRTLWNKKITEEKEKEFIIKETEENINLYTLELKKKKEEFNNYKIDFYLLVKNVEEDYRKFLQSGKQERFTVSEATIERDRQRVNQYDRELVAMQASYNTRYSDSSFDVGTAWIKDYVKRRDKIKIDDYEEISKKLAEQTLVYENIFKNEIILTILKNCRNARGELHKINAKLNKLNFSAKYKFDVQYVKDGSDYEKILEYAEFLNERQDNGAYDDRQLSFGIMVDVDDQRGEELKREIRKIIAKIIDSKNSDFINDFADYRNYMTYELIINNDNLTNAKLSRQIGFNSGAEVQIPYMLILISALLIIYDQYVSSLRIVFIDEPFVKMDPANIKLMLRFMKELNLQVVFCSPDKTESIGEECDVILPVLRTGRDSMQIGIVKFHQEN